MNQHAMQPLEPVPTALQQYQPVGTEEKGESKLLPRLKLVQKSSDTELIERHGLGSLILGADDLTLCCSDEKIVAVPIFWWPSWDTFADINDAARKQNPVLASSLDPDGEIARKAKNPNTREEPYGDGMKCRHCESINFLLAVAEGPLTGQVAVYSWSRAGWKTGSRLLAYLKRRGVAIFGNRVKFGPVLRKNAKSQEFYDLDHGPADDAFVSDETQLTNLNAMYEEAKAAYAAGGLGVAPVGADVSESDVPSGDEPL